MADFAKISEQNKVLGVFHVNDEDAPTESAGQQHLQTHNNWPANLWIKTDKKTLENQHGEGGTPFRGNFAAIGDDWDSENQIFWRPKPFPSWVKDISNAKWVSPIGNAPALTAEQQSQNNADTHLWAYDWNEDNQSWDLNNYKN